MPMGGMMPPMMPGMPGLPPGECKTCRAKQQIQSIWTPHVFVSFCVALKTKCSLLIFTRMPHLHFSILFRTECFNKLTSLVTQQDSSHWLSLFPSWCSQTIWNTKISCKYSITKLRLSEMSSSFRNVSLLLFSAVDNQRMFNNSLSTYQQHI